MSDGMCYRPFEISMLIYYHFFFKGFFPSNICFPTCVKKEEEEKKKKKGQKNTLFPRTFEISVLIFFLFFLF